MNNNNELNQEIPELNNKEGLNNEKVGSIQELQEQTRVSVLDIFYKDEWVFSKVFSIITWKKINPADLVDILWSVREEFKKQCASNEEELEKA